MNARSISSVASRKAFTLLELIVAVTIALVLLTRVLTAARTAYENLQLTRAGQLLVDQIGLARQQASSRNWAVYVYLYKSPALSPVGYSAVQLWRPAPPSDDAMSSPAMIPLDRAYLLPSPVVVSEDATHNSPMLRALTASSNTAPPLTGLPPILTGASYVAFVVKPSGITTPVGSSVASATSGAMSASCLTLAPARCGAQTSTPVNFVTVQINPCTGNCAVYRP